MAPSDELEDALDRDLRAAARLLGPRDLRVLVDHYYALQDLRLQVQNKTRAVAQGRDEGAAYIVGAMLARQVKLETAVKGQLGAWVAQRIEDAPQGPTAWAFRQAGIGPVIAAGLSSYLPGLERVDDADERAAAIAASPEGWERTEARTKEGEIVRGWVRQRAVPPTVGHWWRHAGLDPTLVWGKGEKRPWNAALKTLCAYKIGESFVKVSGRTDAFYGALYRGRKAWELERDLRGDNAAAAAAALKSGSRWTAGQRKTYESGHLPPAQLHRRAVRWTVKLFLAHYHEVSYIAAYGKQPPLPYIIERGHAHKIERPE